MRFRSGLLIGGAVGYYFGAKAGRRRYVQLTRALRKVRESEQLDAASGKVRAIIDLTRERARDAFEQADLDEVEVIDVTTSLN